LASASFADGATAWTVGDHGTVLKTADGGLTWQVQDAGTTASFTKVVATSPAVAWARVDDGAVLRTADGGGSWRRRSATATSIAAASDMVAWAATGTTLSLTTDGGASWSTQQVPDGSPVQAIAVGSNSALWVVTFQSALVTA